MRRALALLRLSRRRTTLATAAAVAVATVAATAAVVTTAAVAAKPDRPPAPPRLNAWQVGGDGDGLHRFVVRLAPDDAPPSAPATRAGGAARAASQLDVAALTEAQARYGTSGVLALGSDGAPIYEVDGRSISVGVATQGASAASPAESGALTKLAAAPGVASAQRLPDGTALVATKLSAQQVAALPGVINVSVSPSAYFDANEAPTPNDRYFGYEWFLKNTGWAYEQSATAGDDIGALAAWPITTGAGTVIADLDSGMAKVPDLLAALWTNPDEPCGTADTDGDGRAGDCHGWNFYRNNADITNAGDNLHGTAVAGSIAATANNGIGVAGEAPGAKVMPLVIGAGHVVDMNLAIVAIYYAVDHGATVINCSFGGYADAGTVSRFKAAVDYAGTHGVLVVASAGNSALNTDVTPIYPAALDDPYLLSVGATDANNNLASFSNYGAKTVDLFAPGVNIATTGNAGGYVLMSGTSFSAPLVATAIAMEKSVDPNATLDQVRDRLLGSLTPASSLAGKGVHAGVLNVGALVSGVHYRFTGLGTIAAGEESQPTLSMSGTAPQGPYTVRLRLATRYQGATYAVSGVPVTVGDTTYTTDDSGSIDVPVSGDIATGISLSPAVSLPAGAYAWVAQLAADGRLVGRPAAAVFAVADPAGPSAAPTASASAGAGGGAGTGGRGSGGGGPTASAAPAPTASPAPAGGSSAAPSQPDSGGSAGGSAGGSSGGSSPAGGTSPSPTSSSAAGGGSTVGPAPAPSSSSAPGTFPAPVPTPAATATPGASSSPAPGSTPAPTSPWPAPRPSGASPPDAKTYPGTDQFGIIALSPSTVSTAGGDLVTISATNLPANISVLVGGLRATLMIGNTNQYVTFFAPAATAGQHDVLVFDTRTGASTTLFGALTYVQDGAGSGSGSGSAGGPTASPAPGGSSPSPISATSSSPAGAGGGGSSGDGGATSGPSTRPSTPTPSPTVVSSPAPAPAPATTPTTTPAAAPTTTPPPAPSPTPTSTVVIGPGGLRLVGGDHSLDGLDALWPNGVCPASGCYATPL